jgi:hypothetical protein
MAYRRVQEEALISHLNIPIIFLLGHPIFIYQNRFLQQDITVLPRNR